MTGGLLAAEGEFEALGALHDEATDLVGIGASADLGLDGGGEDGMVVADPVPTDGVKGLADDGEVESVFAHGFLLFE